MKQEDLKVLIVDDSDFSRLIIGKIVKAGGYTIVGEASSAMMAMGMIKDKKPDVVITDIVMPEVSGIELADQINKNFDGIYVIVTSSLTQEHIVLEAIGAGACDFIPKPIQEQQLKDSLEKIMSEMDKDSF
jgi:two-component system, chemotaxis family, chemotaxis protein CheY